MMEFIVLLLIVVPAVIVLFGIAEAIVLALFFAREPELTGRSNVRYIGL